MSENRGLKSLLLAAEEKEMENDAKQPTNHELERIVKGDKNSHPSDEHDPSSPDHTSASDDLNGEISDSDSGSEAEDTKSAQQKKKRKKRDDKLPPQAVRIMKDWLLSPEHFDYP